ncbi:MAG: hypothetical protein GC204_11325 [Chloroflexi bacterium]|nr:hypothetical protein [Chloroflexota bacterium]
MFPFLSLDDVDLDVELARHLPRRLAYYHLALPIAQDGESITVAMVHPENRKVVSVLAGALDATIIPVRSFAETIRQQLDRVWQIQHGADGFRAIYWAATREALERSAEYVDNLIAALERNAEIERLVSADGNFAASADLVIAADIEPPESLFRTSASLLVMNHPQQPPKAILHVLRGHIPDYRVLDWLVPLARFNAAEVTLFMGVDGGERRPLVSDLGNILMLKDSRQAHIAECRRMLSDLGIGGRLKIRQQTLLSAIRDELEEHPYDLVAIAAEAYGDFAQQVGAIVRERTPAFLVIKP